MQPTLEFGIQCRIYHPLALDPAFARKGIGHDAQAEMALPRPVMSGMAFMPIAVIDKGQNLRAEGRVQL